MKDVHNKYLGSRIKNTGSIITGESVRMILERSLRF